MADEQDNLDEIVDYDDVDAVEGEENKATDKGKLKFTGIHATGFKDFLLKPEL